MQDPSPQFGPGLAPTFLYYFSTTALLFTLIAAKGLGASFDSGLPQQVGLLSGLAAGLAGAYFNRTLTIAIPFKEKFKGKKVFQARLDEALTQMGYQQQDEVADGVLVYTRAGMSQLLSGKVFVQLGADSATIASRATHIRGLRKRLE